MILLLFIASVLFGESKVRVRDREGQGQGMRARAVILKKKINYS